MYQKQCCCKCKCCDPGLTIDDLRVGSRYRVMKSGVQGIPCNCVVLAYANNTAVRTGSLLRGVAHRGVVNLTNGIAARLPHSLASLRFEKE